MVAEESVPGSFDIPIQTCKRCGEPIFEGHAYELGEDRWHIHCFKCSKCETSLGCNSNFLVLGNGNLICSNCSYNCKQCGKKIDDLAILTGDQAYCSSCFKCRSCKLKIEDLRYARTSKGLFCMSCHEKLIAKKKKHDSKKKLMAQDGLQNSTPSELNTPEMKPRDRSNSRLDLLRSESSSLSRSNSRKNVRPPPPELPVEQIYNRSLALDVFTASNRSGSSLSTKDKNLPPPPTEAKTPNSQPLPQDSFHLTKSAVSSYSQSTATQSSEKPWDRISPANSNTSSIEEVVDSDDELNQKTTSPLDRQLHTPPINGQSSNQLQPAAQISSLDSHSSMSQRIESPSFVSKRNFQGKDLLILSPNQYYDQAPSANSPLVSVSSEGSSKYSGDRTGLEPGTMDRQRGNASPFARANRQARVLETSPEHSKDDSTGIEEWPEQRNAANVTPVKRTKNIDSPSTVASPPPRLPLPNVPLTPNESNNKSSDKVPPRHINRSPFKDFNRSPQGLGLEGMEYYDPEKIGSKDSDSPEKKNGHKRQPLDHKVPKAKIIGNQTPVVTNLEDSYGDQVNEQEDLTRKYSLRSTKFSLKHKRSVSGGSGSGLSIKLNPFKGRDDRGHARHVSDGSINGNSAYTTPPLPRTSPMNHPSSFTYSPNNYNGHNRSTSDTPFVSNLESYNTGNEYHKNELELRGMKLEMYQMDSQRSSLQTEISTLSEQKTKIASAVEAIKDKFSKETTNYEILMREIADLEKVKYGLAEENRRLRMENDQLDSSLRVPRNSDIGSTAETTLAASLGSTMPLTKLTSSSSYINETPNYTNYDDQNVETNKATKLKFWRRAKLGSSSSPSSAPVPIQVSSPQLVSQNRLANGSNGMKMSQSHSSTTINPAENGTHSHANSGSGSDFLSVEKPKKTSSNQGSFFTRSKSSNILDSFIGNNSASEKADGNAPLFSSTIQQRATFENELVPFIVTKCIQEVEVRGLDVEGIYRISGGNSAIVNIENCFSNLTGKNDDKYQKLLEALDVDINAVTSALKRYLRKLPEPIIPYNIYTDFIKVGQLKQTLSLDQQVHELKTKVINRLPPANKNTLEMLCHHLNLITQNQASNRMGTKNLSVVFAPTLARDRTGERELTDTGHRNDATELLLENYELVF